MKLLNTHDAAVVLGVSSRRVRKLIEDGTLAAHRIGRELAIEESALDSVKTYGKPGRPPKAATTKQARKKGGKKL